MVYMESDFGQSNSKSRYLSDIHHITIRSGCLESRHCFFQSASRAGETAEEMGELCKVSLQKKKHPCNGEGEEYEEEEWWMKKGRHLIESDVALNGFLFTNWDLSGFQTSFVSTWSVNNEAPGVFLPDFRPDCNSTCYFCFRQQIPAYCKRSQTNFNVQTPTAGRFCTC